MNLIEKYVTEVGKHLPRKNRLDIETELRSTLEDMLEDRSQQAEIPANETLVEELLLEYGAPREVAATYQTHPYLIGPRIFPIYTLVLKIVFAAVTLGLTISAVISMIGSNLSSPEILKALGNLAFSLLGALAPAFGNVTLVFAILERVLPDTDLKDIEDWTPAELNKKPDPDQVSTFEMITGIVFTAIGLIILNFYPQIIGVWNLENGEWVQFVSLSEAFFSYLPWINLSGLLTIALNIILVRKGIWQLGTRYAYIFVHIIGIGIMVALLRGPELLTATNIATIFPLAHLLDNIIPIALLIAIIVSAIEMVKAILGMLRMNKSTLSFKN